MRQMIQHKHTLGKIRHALADILIALMLSMIQNVNVTTYFKITEINEVQPYNYLLVFSRTKRLKHGRNFEQLGTNYLSVTK